jgi:5-formyltetrahydrofolate cyclo-ligase
VSSQTSVKELKAALRKELRWHRNEHFMDASWLHILECKEFVGVNSVASYISYGVEPQTRDLNEALVAKGISVLVPRLLPDKDLEWVNWNGESEPTGPAVGDVSGVGVVIVPALHIDHRGVRLGQGGGSYDRALPRFNAWKLALIHHGELTSEELPADVHDARVDAAATPDLVVRFS